MERYRYLSFMIIGNRINWDILLIFNLLVYPFQRTAKSNLMEKNMRSN